MAVKQAFEQCKTIKTTSDFTGHPQQTILHLLLKHFGKDYIDDIRKEGFKEARQRQTNNFILSQFCRSKKDGKLNHNAYIWLGKSPENNIFIIFGKRIQFCRDNKVNTSLDPTKDHLRKGWTFQKICKVKDYSQQLISKYENITIYD